MRRVFVVSLILALFATIPSRAETPPPEAVAAARALIAATGPTDSMKQQLPALGQLIRPAIVHGRPAVEKDFDAMLPVMRSAFETRMPEITEAIVQIYGRAFTVNEMHDIAAFYRTPTGQKMRQTMPAIAQQSMAARQEIGKRMAAELPERMIDELRKRGHDI